MLDEKQADAIAQTGSFGIAKMVEHQLRAQVLAGPASRTARLVTTPRCRGMTAPPSSRADEDEP